MGKEAKIGLAVILVLLIVFGVVVYNRLSGTSVAGPAASAVDVPSEAVAAEPEMPPAMVTAQPGVDPIPESTQAVVMQSWRVADSGQGSASAGSDISESAPEMSPPSLMPQVPVATGAAPALNAPQPSGAATMPQTPDPFPGTGQLPPIEMPEGPGLGYNAPTTSASVPAQQDQPNPLGDASQAASLTNEFAAASPPCPGPASNANPYATGNGGQQPPPYQGPPAFSDASPRAQVVGTLYDSAEPTDTGSPYGSGNGFNSSPADSFGAGNPYSSGSLSRPVDVGQSLVENGSYTVGPNDNYWTISERLYGTGAYFRALAEFNRKKTPDADRLRPGDKVAAPTVAELEKNFRDLCPKPEHRAVAERRDSTMSTVSQSGSGRVYVVQEGDTLFDIARFELGKASRWAELFELNREALGNQYDYLTPGMKLALPIERPTQRVAEQPGGRLR